APPEAKPTTESRAAKTVKGGAPISAELAPPSAVERVVSPQPRRQPETTSMTPAESVQQQTADDEAIAAAMTDPRVAKVVETFRGRVVKVRSLDH
ncbi:MAG: hypothetical protein AAB353_01340, partial [Candidatus Hydrogenedentota bacterium]